MISAFGAGHDRLRLPGQPHEMSEQGCCHTRHIARHHDHRVVARLSESGVQTAERTAVRVPVHDKAEACGCRFCTP